MLRLIPIGAVDTRFRGDTAGGKVYSAGYGTVRARAFKHRTERNERIGNKEEHLRPLLFYG